MKKILTILFIIICIVKTQAQKENIESGKYYSAKEHFEKEYVKTEYPKYLRSQIKIEKDKIIIDVVKSVIFPESLDRKFKLIFEKGLLDPTLVKGSPVLEISGMDELELLNLNPKMKRFKFWVFQKGEFLVNGSILKGRVNPDEYYFEIQNVNANENTTFEEFVEGAKLTYLAFGTIVL